MGQGTRIAAVNRARRVVWGLGATPALALADARQELAMKSDALRGVGLGRIEFGRLGSKARPDIEDGCALYAHVQFDRVNDAQQELF